MSNVTNEQSESGRATEISINLFKSDSIERAIKMLEKRKAKLVKQSELFVNKLADVGIRAAEKHTGDYKGYISFTKEKYREMDFDSGDDTIVCLLVARDREKIISRWRYRSEPSGWKEAEVSPLLMAEFGSGWFAEVIFPVEEGSVGQGTFPDQKHAKDEYGWWWNDEEGRHYSYGEYPTHPMFHAAIEMLDQIQSVAKGVFG